MKKPILWSLLCLLPGAGLALDAVHPTGVNVNATGPSTVFLTFQGTAGQQAVDAFWCGDIQVGSNTVTSFNPCVAGTLFGHLPPQNNLARPSGTGGQSNTTDIMTIPASVARRAYQDAQKGNNSQFFYVREFRDPVTGQSQFIAVTCRMAGGGARVPLAITRVDLAFGSLDSDQPVTVLERNEVAPPVIARVQFNGSGRLLGRWEVVQPGDPEPTAIDLLSEASLPAEQRNSQRRYTEVGRIDQFLPPSGTIFLPGPQVKRIPTAIAGQYKLLLRLEATSDKEGDSNTGAGVANSGGLAGFSMPPLRYVVAGTAGQLDKPSKSLPLGVRIDRDDMGWVTTWQPEKTNAWLLLRFDFDSGDSFEAVVDAASGLYRLPSWWGRFEAPEISVSYWE